MLASILGTADAFAVLGATTVTSTGLTVIDGNLGVSPGTSITGFGPGVVLAPGVIHAGDAVAAQAQADVAVAYSDLTSRTVDVVLTGTDLGGLTLTPGVYFFASTAQLTGALILDAQGDPNAEFVFQIGSTITTAAASSVTLINGADSCNVYWALGTSATLGANTAFQGNLLASASITFGAGASMLNGRALALSGAVTMDANDVSIDGCGSISWEKRATDANPVLLAGATFVITPSPLTGLGSLTVVDGGPNDADGLSNGVFEVQDALNGTYTVTETVAPTGYTIDPDATRVVTVGGDDYHAVIGVQGADDVGDTDESDFHNQLVVGSVAWEKRDQTNTLQGGATFTMSPDPTDGIGVLTVVDNGAGDSDPAAGQILVVDVPVGTYTITETVAPAGYAIDDDATRVVTVTLADLTQVIGVQGADDPGNTDESDFHNRLGSIEWEKRATDGNPVLLGGATFSISPNPLTGVGALTVVDGGANDADGLANGVLQVNNVLLGTYTITETIAPAGYAIDDDATRSITVSAGDLNAVVGVQGVNNAGDTDESDFHNRLGSIAWEKRATAGNPVLLGGATFSISPNPLTGTGVLVVVDGGANDADGLANGVLQVNDVLLGTYTITETIAPLGYAIDNDATRAVTVSASDLNAVIGVQGVDNPGDTDESDFHNRLGSVAWEKRATDGNPVLLGGATFSISPNPLTGIGALTVVDGGANDADGLANGVLQVDNVLLGTYTITETIAPAGYAVDDDATRTFTVSAADLDAVIGVQGVNNAGDTDESDFHNRLGSIAWEKRATDGNPVLLGGATFSIAPNPLTGTGTLTVVDGGANDADGLANGVVQVTNVLLGAYTITETVAPTGYAIDDDATRAVTVSTADLNAVIGVQGVNNAGDTDESDFHNRLGSIAWEKRATDGNPVLLGGATFSIGPNPLTGIGALVVVDGGVNDADGLSNGVVQVNNVLLAAYTITETIAPAGYTIDNDATRGVTVSVGDLNAVIGVQGVDNPGDTDESDFHNVLAFGGADGLKFNDLDGDGVFDGGEPGLAGWTIYVDYNNDGVLQGTEPSAVTGAGGTYALTGVAPGVWNVREVTQTGWTNSFPATGDAFGRFQTVVVPLNGTVSSVNFGNFLQTSVHGYVFDDVNDNGVDDGERRLNGFPVNLTGVNGMGAPVALNTTSGIGGEYAFMGLGPGTYTVSAGVIAGWTPTTVGTPFSLTSGQEAVVYGGEAGVLLSGQVEVVLPGLVIGQALAGFIVIGPGKNPTTPQFVQIVDEQTGAIVLQFAPYGPTFQGGVRVATGDLNGDGVEEIVVTPGWGIVGDVRVYSLAGVLLTSFLPYGPTFDGGVHAAIADVNGDGVNDIVTVPSLGPAQVRVFLNTIVGGAPTFNAAAPYRDFLAFPASFIGGAVVDAVDMGSSPGATFDTTLPDQRAEIIVGSGAGMTATVKVFDVRPMATSTPTTVPAAAGSFTPFSTPTFNFQGGVSLDVGRFNADPIPDILVGAGVFGGSQVDVWAWNISPAATLSSLSANGQGFAAFTGSTRNWPVEVAAQDSDGDDIADTILAVQGPGGTTGQILTFDVVTASPLVVSAPIPIPGTFPGPYYIDVIETPALAPAQFGVTIADYDRDGRVGGSDFLLWQRTLGSTQALAADGDHSGVIDAGDLQLWRDTYGEEADSVGSVASAVVASTTSAFVAIAEPETPVVEKVPARASVPTRSSRLDSYFLTLGTAVPGPRAARAASRPTGVAAPQHRRCDEPFFPTPNLSARPERWSIKAFDVRKAAKGLSVRAIASLDGAFEFYT